MKAFRAILFDLDNTLLPEDDATYQALRETGELARRRTGADAEVLAAAAADVADSLFRAAPVFPYADAIGIWWGEALWGEFAGDGPALSELRAFVPGFRREVWSRALGPMAAPDGRLADELAAAFGRIRRGIHTLYPDAEGALDDLARDHRLGLVTNGAGDVQRAKLAATTIASRFDAVVVSGDLGVGKPDPRVFRVALDTLGVPAAEAAMVGDDPTTDIVGARHAGLRSVLIDRTGGSGGAAGDQDARIRTLDELRGVLAALEHGTALPQPA